MRDLLVTLVVFGSIPLIFMRPYVGILVWCWLSFMNPHRLTYGFAYTMPFVMVVSLVTIACMMMTDDKVKIPKNPVTILLVVFFVYTSIMALFSLNPSGAYVEWDRFLKTMVMVFVTLILINNITKLHQLIWVIVLSFGLFGIKGGIFTLLTGGHHRVYGPEGSFFYDNNEMALVLLMTVPLMGYLFAETRSKWIKLFLAAMMGLSVLAILASYSRGALVGGAVLLAMMIWRAKQRILLSLVLSAVLGASLQFMPAEWFDRMSTISEYQKDDSAKGRLNAWEFAWNLARDQPMGAGLRAFTKEAFRIYAPNPDDHHAAHSIYFQVLAEEGFPGLFMFLMLGLLTILLLRRTIKETKHLPELKRINNLASALYLCIIAYASGGAFLSLAYFDYFYQLIVLAVICQQLVKGHLAGSSSLVVPKQTSFSGHIAKGA